MVSVFPLDHQTCIVFMLRNVVSDAKMTSPTEDINDLEYQYSPSRWVVRLLHSQTPIQHFVNLGIEVKKKLVLQLTCELDIEYGNGKKTKLDVYYPSASNKQTRVSDVLIFIHGGYWQEGSKDCYGYLGCHLNDLNCILVMAGYDLAPDISMDGIVKQIKSAVVCTGKKFPSSRLFLCGHSAGAHLSAMMMVMNWDESSFETERIAGVCLLSGIYDLEPLVSTYVNDPIEMDKEIAARNSPMKIVRSSGLTIKCSVLFAIAEHDSPAFHEESKNFYSLLKEKLPHHNVEYVDLPGVDHFDMLEKCVEKDWTLNKVLANFIKN